jgi:GT2 family glycosyltransferase
MTDRLPRLSVVVPSYERPAQLEACLKAMAAQRLAREDFEVIVVDDGSACPPRELVEQFRPELNVRLLEQHNAGPAAARGSGARQARGAHVVFTDDDCRPDPLWLGALSSCIAAHPEAAVGGRIVNVLGERLCSSASQLLIDFLYRYHNRDAADSRFLITSNLAFPLSAFLAIGGFDATFPLAAGEDRDLCERWREAGHPMVYCPEAVVAHAHDLGVGSFLGQHFNYGRGAHHLHRARARRGKGRFRLETVGFYARLIVFPFRSEPVARALVLSMLLALSQLGYVAGYVFERLRR